MGCEEIESPAEVELQPILYKIKEKRMKRKKISKKFTLNKQTVANLDRKSLSSVFGGIDTDPESTCIYCPTEDAFCEPTKTACTGSPCPTYDPYCDPTLKLTCMETCPC